MQRRSNTQYCTQISTCVWMCEWDAVVKHFGLPWRCWKSAAYMQSIYHLNNYSSFLKGKLFAKQTVLCELGLCCSVLFMFFPSVALEPITHKDNSNKQTQKKSILLKTPRSSANCILWSECRNSNKAENGNCCSPTSTRVASPLPSVLPVCCQLARSLAPGWMWNSVLRQKRPSSTLSPPSPDSSFHRQRPCFLLWLRRNTERLTWTSFSSHKYMTI